MATLAEIIKKRKAAGELTPDSLRAFIDLELERRLAEALQKALPDALGDMNSRVEKALNLVIDERVAKALKGDKGDPGESIRGEPGKDAEDLDEVVTRAVPIILAHIRQPSDGKPGSKGEPGEDGYTPIPGKDYPTIQQVKEIASAVAEKTLMGKRGKDGSPDTPDQVVEKINKAENKIKPEKVEGLVDKMNDLARRKGGGSGGGMGNVVPHSVAISSATITITLPNNVASNGRAIWFNYQGQQQAYGTHFTVSGKVITLLFTPSDDTWADILYIRT